PPPRSRPLARSHACARAAGPTAARPRGGRWSLAAARPRTFHAARAPALPRLRADRHRRLAAPDPCAGPCAALPPAPAGPRFLPLLAARVSGEAVNLTLPAGGAVAEAITPSLLYRRCGIAVRDGVVAMAARRWTVLRAHALYLAAGGIVGLMVATRPPALP